MLMPWRRQPPAAASSGCTPPVERQDHDRFLQTLVQNLPVALYRCSVDPPYRQVLMSDGIESISGYPPERFLGADGLSFSDVVLPEDLPTATRLTQCALAQRAPWEMEYRIRTASGEVRALLDRGRAYYDDAGRPLWLDGILFDITERRQAESRARERERQLQSLFENVPGVVYRCDIEPPWTHAEISDGILELSGWAREDFLRADGPSMADLVLAEDLTRVAASIARAVARCEPYDVEWRLRRRDGAVRWVNERGRAQYDDLGRPQYLDGIIIDVTDRRTMEQSLRESEASLSRAQTVAHVGSWECDCLTGRMRWSGETRRVCGLAGAYEPTLESFRRNVHPEDRERVAGAWRAGEADGVYDVEYRLRDGDTLRWIHEQAEFSHELCIAVAAIGTVQDVTERRLAEERLRQSHALLDGMSRAQHGFISDAGSQQTFETLLECFRTCSASEYGFIADVVSGDDERSCLRPRAITSIAGDAETRALHEQPADGGLEFHDPDSLFGLALRSEQPLIVNDSDRLRSGSGLPDWLPPLHAFLGLPLRNEGRLIGLVGLANRCEGYDGALVLSLQPLLVTCASLLEAFRLEHARAVAEDELRKLNQHLEQRVAERTAELESFAYSVSHDLKAPLRAIDGYSRILITEHADSLAGDAGILLGNVCRATQSMSALIDDLLDYSRVERVALVDDAVDVGAVLRLVLAEAQEQFTARGIAVEATLPELCVAGHAEGVALVFRNLVANAIKFTCGCVQPRIGIGWSNSESSLTVHVTDNGCGFDMKYHDRIFKIFERLHRTENYPGTGIGLAIVRKAVARMGGRVWAESAPGAGATFFVELRRVP